MRVRRLIAGMLCVLAGASAARAEQAPRPLDPRLSRLELWIETVLQHQFGAYDHGVAAIGSWHNPELRMLWIDANAVVTLMRYPGRTNFSVKVDGAATAVPVRYTPDQLLRLRQLACVTGGIYNQSACAPLKPAIDQDATLTRLAKLATDVRPGNDTNFILRRAALLHSDIFALGLATAVEPLSFGGPSQSSVRVTIADGHETGVTQDATHWEIARRLLDQITAPGTLRLAPERDDMVRAWYRATATWMERDEHHETTHLARALDLFPTDPDLLFLEGCQHEAFAGPPIQMAVRSAILPTGVKFDVASERSELRDAERSFRRALDARPDFAEARLHYGRVLALLGRDAEAALELRKAVPGLTEELLQYFGGMFLGSAEETLGRFEAAQAGYERAMALFPAAQSPRMALSQLARRSGKRDAALGRMEEVFRLRDDDEQSDPWWLYFRTQGRAADQLLMELGRPFVLGARP